MHAVISLMSFMVSTNILVSYLQSNWIRGSFLLLLILQYIYRQTPLYYYNVKIGYRSLKNCDHVHVNYSITVTFIQIAGKISYMILKNCLTYEIKKKSTKIQADRCRNLGWFWQIQPRFGQLLAELSSLRTPR